MKKRGTFLIPNIILGVILVFVLAIAVLIIPSFEQAFKAIEKDYKGEYQDKSSLQEENNFGSNYDRTYSLLSLGESTVEAPRITYHGRTPKNGYYFYRINIPVQNQGNGHYDTEYLSITFQGEDYDDVQGADVSFESSSWWSNYNYNIIPAGQTGIYSEVIQVKKGVEQLEMLFYNGTKEEIYTITLP